MATGIVATVGGVGGVIFPILLTHLLDKIGFGWALRTGGILHSSHPDGACNLLEATDTTKPTTT